MELTFHLNDIHLAAKTFWQAASVDKVFAFYGEMGAGKTTFIHSLCEVLGVTDTVGSPTFSLINEYQSAHGSIFHIDLYRVKDDEEAIRAGIEDCLFSGNICFVEWAQKAPSIFPEETVSVFLTVINEQNRHLQIDKK
ncbi:MAG: tRNA (adenosine(37)-N6)-threonylcarbamoyltransferase complex ATPase subunit type 1 TsaE [Chitinophagaceae bacterium]|nr:tRNA (adenosine(37)-N6)-threonylcarbamoyltransferase complex ATPase subunit type 1 TsaE [Chitinophagaceae bacterium]